MNCTSLMGCVGKNALWAAIVVLLFAGFAQPSAANPTAAQIIKAKGCGACHRIPGIPEAWGTVGPSLKGLAERPRIAGGRLENTDENLRDWLKNPKGSQSQAMMPNLGLEDSEIEILIAFLKTL